MPGQNSYESVIPDITTDRESLWINDPRYQFTYPSGTEFRAVFSDSPNRKQYTITLKAAEWINNGWQQNGDYGLFWTGEGVSSARFSITKSFYDGDVCNFQFSGGSDSSGHYEFRGVKDSNRNGVSGVTEKNGFSFTVTSNVTYYIEVIYIRDDNPPY